MDTVTPPETKPYPKDIIERLGGPVAVAAACNPQITHGAVCQWERIPLQHMDALVEFSIKEKKGVSAQEMFPYVRWSLVKRSR